MLIKYFFTGLTSFLAGIFFIHLFKKFVLKYKILSSRGIPLAGGISIGITFIVVSTFTLRYYGVFSQTIVGVLAASAIMLIFGLMDDLKEMPIVSKFLVQIIATALLIIFGIRTHIVSIGNLANIVITFIWVLAITNGFNHLDIMDGLAGGIAVISSLGFLAVSLINQDIAAVLLSLVLAGALFSFLIYNLPPARVYLGNAGSHFLGFILASIAIIISYASLERKLALLSPVLILGFPIFDTAFLIVMRLRKNISPFKKSDDHLSLRLLRNGYPKNKTLILMLFLGIFFVLSGITLSKMPNFCGLALLMLIILSCLLVTIRAGKLR